MDYSNGKIYCIRNYLTDDIYVGSSCQPLCKRLSWHNSSLNKQKCNNNQLYRKMREIGKEHFYIELLEKYPCSSKEELRAREGQYIRQIGNLNKRIENRTKQQWTEDNIDKVKKAKEKYYEENKDIVKDRVKQHYEENKEEKLEYQKRYYERHKEKIKDRESQYRRNNSEKIKEHAYEKISCECGAFL